MKIILNEDVKNLGEEGDIKDVAKGYARNYLFPRNLAVPSNDFTIAYFESKRAEIETRKDEKRKDAASLKERLEQTAITITMTSGANGKLYGAVTNQTIVDELAKLGFDIERKRIEVPGLTLKNVGKYTIVINLYESSTAEISIEVEARSDKDSKADREAAKQKPVAAAPVAKPVEEAVVEEAETADEAVNEESSETNE